MEKSLLSVIWRNNKKAWMTAATMEEWLNMFNAKLKKENKNIILFLDSATCHPKVTLSNVKITWFPANAKSVLQPMDMGVFLHIQIALQTISDAIYYFECIRSQNLLCISKICIGSGCCELDRVGSEEN
jgi:hypothetical protein